MKKFFLVISTFLAVGGAGCASMPNPGSTLGPSQPSHATSAKLQITPSSASFHNVIVGSSSSQTVTLSNTGGQDTQISSGNVSGQGFSITGITFPLTLTAGGKTSFNIEFAPTSAAASSGSLVLANSNSSSSLNVSLSGTAEAATHVLALSTTSLAFGNVTVGDSGALVVTVKNNGNSDVDISSVTTSGAGFRVSGIPAGTKLPPDTTTTLNASFSPSAAGAASGGFSIASNASSSAQASMRGMGVQASSHTVALNWDASTSTVSGYNIYRLASDGSYTKLNSVLVTSLQFTDTSVQAGQTYKYAVTCIDADSVESSYSSPVIVSIPAS